MTISILCGGSGTRLFPLSRELFPKQFVSLLPKEDMGHSLFQETLLRNEFLLQAHNGQFQIITNDNHYFIAQEQAHKCGITLEDFILESLSKNTAPALSIAALSVYEAFCLNRIEDDIILALPSDHLVKNMPMYQKAIEEAIALANKGFLVTFGIMPTSPHTGYGYIKAKDNIVEQFVEKPSLEDAKAYLADGHYLWNSGMFCFRAEVFLKELKTHAPDVYESCKLTLEASKESKGSHFIRLDKAMSAHLPNISIDYALMEKSQKVACVCGEFEWDDIGSFESLSKQYPKDSANNASKNEFVSKDCSNNFIISNKLVAAIGVDDLMVIDESDCLLIAKKGHSQAIRDIVCMLKDSHPELTQVHRSAHRPWGSYCVLLESQNYKIKQIVVKPKGRLSLQKHYHRNEHWIVVSGSAYVTIGEHKSFLKANESTYIPMGEVHRLENPGVLPLVLIEVQMGEYLGEDDIVRLSDDYQRC
ncbi:mannose-1-phosphate guanylyltransferase/mannose-6-phosphate isomerase [Helicobacter marmotae]|uniref:mannose-1-phosphate guanylyltransferase n=1 Tax=Helicobacter marmotae TaxID=152490 RepID=A0A3D8I7Z1_9HELI|nr:mannose-1-phosphate guanylyltransferase/mannose-6-phosphate isomerase [Helicobacter marmotae]RDU61106.1 mannose-1-phosphate guanylyltransferase/mannose-6-phosphate isomerase [Helicobacter marmotae]